MENMELFITLLSDVLDCAHSELSAIEAGLFSSWRKRVIENSVIPEMSELLEHALNGELYFRYGEKQRLLLSSYMMTDTLENLEDTNLGKKITAVQNLYWSL